MPAEGEPKVNLERYAWRTTGIGIALGAVRLLATMPHPSQLSDEQLIQFVGVGFFTPAWAMWGQTRGWLIEDVNKAISSTKSLLGLRK